MSATPRRLSMSVMRGREGELFWASVKAGLSQASGYRPFSSMIARRASEKNWRRVRTAMTNAVVSMNI